MPPPPLGSTAPARVRAVHECEVIAEGLSRMLEPYADLVTVLAGEADPRAVDIALFDPVGSPVPLVAVRREHEPASLVLYTWDVDDPGVREASRHGVAGVIAKDRPAAALVEDLVRVRTGQTVRPAGWPEDVARPGATAAGVPVGPTAAGLTPREVEVLTWVARGLSNLEISAQMYLSPNTVKTYIRSAYRTMGVRTRSQAVLWAVQHGVWGTRAAS